MLSLIKNPSIYTIGVRSFVINLIKLLLRPPFNNLKSLIILLICENNLLNYKIFSSILKLLNNFFTLKINSYTALYFIISSYCINAKIYVISVFLILFILYVIIFIF